MEEDKSQLDVIINNTGLKIIKIIEEMGMNRTTWYRKRNNPGGFTIDEIQKLSEILKADPVEIFTILVQDVRKA